MQQSANTAYPDPLGNPWKIIDSAVHMNASTRVKEFIASEAVFTHSYYKSISQLLGVVDPTGGVIIDNADWSLILGKFETEMGALVAAEGEMVELVTPDFDYCLSRLSAR
ncbi:MAG: hypothetical protein HC767_09990 [Akkermansiaceae bacterium]|nr:hypothetical protein [Akkermansiaceae bacterium]